MLYIILRYVTLCYVMLFAKLYILFLIVLSVQRIRKCMKRNLTYIDICIYLNINTC